MELPLPRDNQYLFLDMNAFFASCEQHRNPDLRSKPVAVTPTVAPSGCVIAASYEAKRQGVTTGCRVGEAREHIPAIHVVKADHRYYVTIHKIIADFLYREVSPDTMRLSIDEFAIPLTPSEQWSPNAHQLAIFIQRRLEALFSPFLRCSIGIGPNMFLAKLGTEIQKPNGLVITQLHTLAEAYKTLKLRDIPGINWGMSNRLCAIGIRTPVVFFEAPRTLLHAAFGITGDAWWYNLHGYRVAYKPEHTKSMSHSHVLAPVLRTKTKARDVLYKLWLKVAERLREKQLATREVWVAIRGNGPRWSTGITVRPTQNPFVVFDEILCRYDRSIADYFHPNHIVVIATRLEPYRGIRFELSPEDSPKVDDLFHSVDAINNRYGRWTVRPASLLSIHDSAPNRIAFRVPDYEMD